MTDAISAALWDISGSRMYVGNAFRLTELPTDAERQAALHGRQRAVTMQQIDPDLASPEVLEAFDLILGDPRRRLVDEIFWLWDTKDAECGCTGSLHSDHDAAVRAHSGVLDSEGAARDRNAGQVVEWQRQWELSGQLWGQLLRRTAFWEHIRHRIVALDDRQLDQSAIDSLRDLLPVVLVKPLVQLAVSGPGHWRAKLAREWPVPRHVVDDQLEEAVGPLYETVDQATTSALQSLDEQKPYMAATLMAEQEKNRERMNELVPADRHRRTASVLNAAAVAYNNCCNTLVSLEGVQAVATCRAWFDVARALASDQQTIRTIEQNRSGLEDLTQEIEQLEWKINELIAAGRWRQARALLLDLERQLTSDALAVDINRLLVRVERASSSVPGRGTTTSSPGKRAAVFTIVLVVVVLLALVFFGGNSSATGFEGALG